MTNRPKPQIRVSARLGILQLQYSEIRGQAQLRNLSSYCRSRARGFQYIQYYCSVFLPKPRMRGFLCGQQRDKAEMNETKRCTNKQAQQALAEREDAKLLIEHQENAQSAASAASCSSDSSSLASSSSSSASPASPARIPWMRRAHPGMRQVEMQSRPPSKLP